MVDKLKIDFNSPYLMGKVFETNDEQTELKYPPVDPNQNEQPTFVAGKESDSCDVSGCKDKIRLREEGSDMFYTIYKLTNLDNGRDISVTLERTWMYEGQLRKDTVRHKLYPLQTIDVFKFPRNQDPTCKFLTCCFN